MAEISTAGIFRKDGLFLVAKRRPGGSMGGRWEFPGGKAEKGETAEEALAREIREELGAQITVGRYICETKFSNGAKEYILKVFEAAFETPPGNLKEHQELRWLRWDEIDSLELADSDREVYEKLKTYAQA